MKLADDFEVMDMAVDSMTLISCWMGVALNVLVSFMSKTDQTVEFSWTLL